MLLSFVAGALGAPLDELGIDLNGDGIPDHVVEFDTVDFDPEINGDLVEVDGYFRADGTWVEPHLRTAPDGMLANNLSWWDLINA